MLRRPPPVARHTVFRVARSARIPDAAVAVGKRAKVSMTSERRERESRKVAGARDAEYV